MTTLEDAHDEFGRIRNDGPVKSDDDEESIKRRLQEKRRHRHQGEEKSRRHGDLRSGDGRDERRDNGHDSRRREDDRRRNDNDRRHHSDRRNHDDGRYSHRYDDRDRRYNDERPHQDDGDGRYNERGYDDDARRSDERHDDARHQDFSQQQRQHGSYGAYGEERHYQEEQRRMQEEQGQRGTVVRGRISRIEPYGAFLDFEPRRRGLIHISQMSFHRVEKVEDVVQLNQEIYAVILDIENGFRNRIRLSLNGVNQETGQLDPGFVLPSNEHGRGGGGGGGAPVPIREMQHRATKRIRMFERHACHWREENGGRSSMAPRDLWSASPSPPARLKEAPKGRAKDEESSSSSDSDSDSSSSESSSSSSSSESSRDRRRRRSRRTSSSRRRKRGRDRRRRSRRRSRSSSSSESSSRSSSSESSSSSSSSESSASSVRSRDEKRAKREEVPDTVEAQAPVLDEEEMRLAREMKKAVQGQGDSDEDDDDDFGPMPLPLSNATTTAQSSSKQYGGALLPGEGQAIAQYVQQNLRIPRRGEIGYGGDEIEQYEKSGYVMSGSRHARMNAVRIRKENQVYSAEEQRALALITMEENQQKEAQLLQDFRTMLKNKQKLRERPNDEKEKA